MFLDLDWTLMEMNPFTLDAAGFPFPLDMRGELDDTAAFKSGKKCAPVCAHACPCLISRCLPPPCMHAAAMRWNSCSYHGSVANPMAVPMHALAMPSCASIVAACHLCCAPSVHHGVSGFIPEFWLFAGTCRDRPQQQGVMADSGT